MFAAIGISLEWGKGKPSNQSFRPPIIRRSGDGGAEEFQARFTGVCLSLEGSHITVFVDRIERMRTPT